MEGEQTSSAVRYGGARLSWRKYVKRLSCRNRIGETIRAAAMMKKRLRGGHAARRALLMAGTRFHGAEQGSIRLTCVLLPDHNPSSPGCDRGDREDCEGERTFRA